MELVDANTKNYVFLTLSQYNDQQELVRTRVSMRRDQPFWDGGNSYICCESFRISSSPSQGGLYYKIFPYGWYMGCKLPQDRGPQPGGADEFWEDSVTTATGGDAHEVGIMLTGSQGALSNNDQTWSTRLNVQGMTDQLNVGALQSQDPNVCRTSMESFLNQYFLFDRSWVRLYTETGAQGNTKGWLIGQCKGNPALAITGNGLGIDKLYYPETGVLQPSLVVPTLGVLAALSEAAMVDTPFEFALRMYPQPNSGQQYMQKPEFDNIVKQMGKGLHLQVRTATAHPRAWQPMVYGAIWNVLGLYGVEYFFQQQFFGDSGVAPATTTEGNCTGPPARPMRYNELKVGAVCWIDIGVDDAKYAAGHYVGKISAFPEYMVSAHRSSVYGFTSHLQVNLHVQATSALWNLVKTGVATTLEKKTELCEQRLILTTDGDPIAAAIHTNITFDISDQLNLGDPPTFGNETPTVQFAANRNTSSKLCIRRPEKYMYTPNEMFYAFNHEEKIDETYVHLPYKLQTDENGGFCVWWTPQQTQTDSFVIAIGLSEALGLNTYFEYDYDEHLDDVEINMCYVVKVNFDPQQYEDEPAIWLEHNDLSMQRDDFVRLPMPAPPGTNGAPLEVWDRDKVEYTYVRSYQYVESQFQTIKRRIYPTTHVDADGIPFYRYNNLPGRGVITNTQMVSVESFSTYSEITIVVPNLPFQSMLGTNSDERVLASLRLPFENGTNNNSDGGVVSTTFSYYGDLIFNTLASRSYLKVTTDQALYDCDVEVRLIRRDGEMDVMQLPFQGEFQVKLRMLQTQ